MADYHKAGLLTVRGGRILLCRKRRGTGLLILPGGCLESGETALECLARELREELGDVEATALEFVGTYADRAAGEPGKNVRIELYTGELNGEPAPHSEIAELVWFGQDDDRTQLAPSIVNRILPDLLARGILPWPPATELLAPARDLECGIAAIDCGADAVYIGAPRFGAREAAGNSIDEIAELARYAHRYWARVYVTLNTLLRDDELEPARRLAFDLHSAGIDGLIIQDCGLLEGPLPPLPLIASTQMHNHTPERVAFLEKVGFRRAILARELSLDEIRGIRAAAQRIELESFIHGALCVCYSGQCSLSYALGGRSGNRGQCAQPCRKPYSLVDGDGNEIAAGHLLSLRDLNLSAHLPALLAAGITSFKIEGRLKDRTYVANVVAHYRAKLDEALAACGLRRSSSGVSTPGFVPDPTKTFNRGYTTYFLHGRGTPPGSPETPKMVGEEIGRVMSVSRTDFALDCNAALHPGDGLAFFCGGELRGTSVNAVNGRTITPDRMDGIEENTVIYRNHDHEFLTRVTRSKPERRIPVRFRVEQAALVAVDEDGNRAGVPMPAAQPAEKPEKALHTLRRQLEKTGDTEFACADVEIAAEPAPFLPVSEINGLRRDVLERLRAVRETNRPRMTGRIEPNDEPFPVKELDYRGNVLNRDAEAFYRRHGVTAIEPAAESGLDMRERKVMTTRYCLKEQLGLCGAEGPLALIDEQGNRLELEFDCGECEMSVYLR